MYEGLNRLFQSMPRVKAIHFARVYSGVSGISTATVLDYINVLSASGKIYQDCLHAIYPNRETFEKMTKERERTWEFFQASGRNDD